MADADKYVEKNCSACGDIIQVRLADHKRGWGKFCDKSCAAAYKTGQRPRDVNKGHAKYSAWAAERMESRAKYYGGNPPPKAKPLKDQLGRNPKVRKVYHSPSSCRECGAAINGPGKCFECGTHDEAMAASEDGWDGHKS